MRPSTGLNACTGSSGSALTGPRTARSSSSFTGDRFQENSGNPAWAAGLYNGRIHIAAQALVPHKADGTLAHEYTHAIVHLLSSGHASTWLQEGLARYSKAGRHPGVTIFFSGVPMRSCRSMYSMEVSWRCLPTWQKSRMRKAMQRLRRW